MIINEENNYRLKDYDIWYLPCSKCQYYEGKSTTIGATCWKCGNSLQRDFSDKALKQELKESK